MEAKQKMEKMDLLAAMGEIVTQAKDSKLSDDFYSKVKPYTDYICEVLEECVCTATEYNPVRQLTQ